VQGPEFKPQYYKKKAVGRGTYLELKYIKHMPSSQHFIGSALCYIYSLGRYLFALKRKGKVRESPRFPTVT
jgi:hypothetical protein